MPFDLSDYLWPDASLGRQPQTGIPRVNKSNPLAAGLGFAVIGGLPINLVTGLPAIQAGTPTSIVKDGKAYHFDGSTSNPLVFANAGLVTSNGVYTGDFAFIVRFNPTYGGNRNFLFSQASTSGGNQTTLTFNDDPTYNSATGAFGLTSYCTPAGVAWGATCGSYGSVLTGASRVFCVVRRSGNLELWVDGIQQTITSSLNTPNSYPIGVAGVTPMILGDLNVGGGVPAQGDMPWALGFNRAPSGAEIAKIGANPYSLFAANDSWLPLVVVGGSALAGIGVAIASGSGILTAPGPVAFSSTGAARASGSATLAPNNPVTHVSWDTRLSSSKVAWTLRVAAGIATAFSASGQAVASGSATLSVAMPLSASGQGVAAGSATLSIASALAGVGQGIASGSGTLAIVGQAALSGTGVAMASGYGQIATSVPLAGVGTGIASGSATLTSYLPGALSGSGTARASGYAALSLAMQLAGVGQSVASGQGTLSIVGQATLAGSGQAVASGYAALSTSIAFSASGQAIASGSAVLTVFLPGALAGTGQAVANGYGTLSLALPLAGTGSARASGQATLTSYLPVLLSGSGTALASGFATMTANVYMGSPRYTTFSLQPAGNTTFALVGGE